MIFNTDVLSTAFHKIENIDSTLHCPIISGVKSQYKNRVFFIYIFGNIVVWIFSKLYLNGRNDGSY